MLVSVRRLVVVDDVVVFAALLLRITSRVVALMTRSSALLSTGRMRIWRPPLLHLVLLLSPPLKTDPLGLLLVVLLLLLLL